MNAKNRENSITLEILQAIGEQSDVSQRRLASRLGVALGLANSYLKRCVRKGWVKITLAPANRYLYYLTPTGFSEKSRLTREYLSVSFVFYRQAGRSCEEVFSQCRQQGWLRLVLCGASELAEIAFLRAQEYEVEIIGTYDRSAEGKRFLRLPLWRDTNAIPPCDGFLLTDLKGLTCDYEGLLAKVGAERFLIPEILGTGLAR